MFPSGDIFIICTCLDCFLQVSSYEGDVGRSSFMFLPGEGLWMTGYAEELPARQSGFGAASYGEMYSSIHLETVALLWT